MKYILVTGGVISGVGKGIVSSCIGTVLRSRGWHVTCIKIDPYLNIDAGTFSPYEHGEVFVLDDGSEVDLDLGNYERFLDINLTRDHNITTGRVYKSIIERERRGDFLGKTVQVVPHVTEQIQDWVESAAKIPVDSSKKSPEICIIELGGTIGEIESMPFVESFRQMLMKIGQENFCCIHVSLIPTVGSVGEPKTKPTQMSVWELRNKGLKADILICRSSDILPDSVMDKLSQMCFVERRNVFSLPDMNNTYQIPSMMEENKLTDYILGHFKLPLYHDEFNKSSPCLLDKWTNMISKMNTAVNGTVRISLVGKYTKLRDSYISVLKAIQHASAEAQCVLELELIDSAEFEGFLDSAQAESGKEVPDPEREKAAWVKIMKSHSVIIPGGFGTRGITGKLNVVRFCREHGIPILGICLGYQCMTIEFARNVLHMPNASSTEFDADCKDQVVIEMPEHNSGTMGGTMRLGLHSSTLSVSPVASKYLNAITPAGDSVQGLELKLLNLLKMDKFYARHRHRYEVNPAYIDRFEEKGFIFIGRDSETKQRMEIAELARKCPKKADAYTPECIRDSQEFKNFRDFSEKQHPYFVGAQFHPEYTSRPTIPSPLFLGLIYASIGKLDEFTAEQNKTTTLFNGKYN